MTYILPYPLTIQIIDFKSIRIGTLIPQRDLDNISVAIEHLGWCVLHHPRDDLGVFFGKPSEKSGNTLTKHTYKPASKERIKSLP